MWNMCVCSVDLLGVQEILLDYCFKFRLGIRREDLRHLCVCSVDPPGCKDIDDALHVRRLPNGNREVGVHIADVTNFLHPGTAMDAEAASRCGTHGKPSPAARAALRQSRLR